jgi:hypothetical protein
MRSRLGSMVRWGAACALAAAFVAPAPAGAFGDGVIGGGGGVIGGVGLAATSYVTIFHPGSGTADPSPDLVPFVDCTVVSGGDTTYWWGYTLTADSLFAQVPMDLTPSLSNAMLVYRDGSLYPGSLNRGQTTNFQPGEHHMVFAVTVPSTDTPHWLVDTANLAGGVPAGGYYNVSAVPAFPPSCASSVTARSATPQALTAAAITVTPAGLIRNVAGQLVHAKLKFAVTGVTSACNVGGKPMPVKALWGYVDRPFGGTANLKAIPNSSIVRTDTFSPAIGPSVNVARTAIATRVIADPQRSYTTTQGVSSKGMAATDVIVDVTARCRYGTGASSVVVESASTHWVTGIGGPQLVAEVTDFATQSPRPVNCTVAMSCELYLGIGPGGSKYR